jgi:hypothetical protein
MVNLSAEEQRIEALDPIEDRGKGRTLAALEAANVISRVPDKE